MLMRKIKFKILILLIFVLSMNKYSLDIFADTPSPDAPNTKPIKNNSTVLDGEIGEWNPTLDDKLDFSKNEVDGHIPNIDEYYTISVTVPLNMEFMVLPNSTRPFGSFFSPIYNIKNNGKFESGEIGLPMTGSKLVLPCGIYGRWEEDNA